MNDDESVTPSTCGLEAAKCNTCKAIFSTIEKAKEHYRSEWHVFNSKRRGNNLPPLTKSDFKKALPLITANKPKPLPKTNQQIRDEAAAFKENSNIESIENKDGTTNEEGENEQVEESEESEDEAAPELLVSTISLFDNKTFETTDENIEYMAIKYGFFIPDIEYLTDQNGLIEYLHHKIKLGKTCIFCQQKFSSYYGCQNHMISKSHCKIAYDEKIDGDEYNDFYDFSSTYEDIDEDNENDDENTDNAEISHLGELILPNGKIVGNRVFRLVYKQKFRPIEDRPSVLAYQREELLRLGILQHGGSQITIDQVNTMTDIQVMSLLIKQQRDIRAMKILAERSQRKHDFVNQRREYKSTVDKLRSSATTTAKIRDYHSRLV